MREKEKKSREFGTSLIRLNGKSFNSKLVQLNLTDTLVIICT